MSPPIGRHLKHGHIIEVEDIPEVRVQKESHSTLKEHLRGRHMSYRRLCVLPISWGTATMMLYRAAILWASWRVNVEILLAQLHSIWSEELASSSPRSPSDLELSSVTSRPWEAESHWDDSVQEISGVCPSSGLERPEESPLNVFPEST